jgi:hypothetical protein
MSTQAGVTLDRDLLSGLRPEICANGTDEFCSSSRANWPQLADNQTRIIYGNDDPEESVQGSEYLCIDYQNWLAQMAHVDNADRDLTRAFLQRIDPSGARIDRYSQDMTKLSEYCNASLEGRQPPVAPGASSAPDTDNAVPSKIPSPEDVGSWLDTIREYIWKVGGGVAAVLLAFDLAVTRIYKRVIKLFKTLANVGEFRNADPDKVADYYVVLGQLEDHFSNQKEAPKIAFGSLSFKEKLYLSYRIIKDWEGMRGLWRRAYIAEGGVLDGGLPNSYLEERVQKYKGFKAIKAAAADSTSWSNEVASHLEDEVRPVEENVIDQVLPLVKGQLEQIFPSASDATKLSIYNQVLKYLALDAIKGWRNLTGSLRRNYLRETLEKVAEGRLPDSFVRRYVDQVFSDRSALNPKQTVRQAAVYFQILAVEESRNDHPFEENAALARRMLAAWGVLDAEKRREFGAASKKRGLPVAFIKNQLGSMKVPMGEPAAPAAVEGAMALVPKAAASAAPPDSSEPRESRRHMASIFLLPLMPFVWLFRTLRGERLMRRMPAGFDTELTALLRSRLDNVSLSPRVITREGLDSYVALLKFASKDGDLMSMLRYLEFKGMMPKLRADWQNLPPELRSKFEKEDIEKYPRAITLEVPLSYIRFWAVANMDLYQLSDAVIVLDDDDDDPDNGPAGGGTAGGATGGGPTMTGFSPPSESGSSSAPPAQMSQVNPAVVPGAAIYTGGLVPSMTTLVNPSLWTMPLMPALLPVGVVR